MIHKKLLIFIIIAMVHYSSYAGLCIPMDIATLDEWYIDFHQIRDQIDKNATVHISTQKPDFKRNNIFKDIKSSLKYRNDSEEYIEEARKAIKEAKSVPNGYSIKYIKRAEESLISAEVAFKSQKYFESISRACESIGLAYESMPFRNDSPPNPLEDIDISYDKYLKNGNEIMAEITCKNSKTNIGFTKKVRKDEIISGELSNSISVDIDDGKTITVKKFEFQIEDILPNKIFLKNITTKAPIFSISMPDKPKLK